MGVEENSTSGGGSLLSQWLKKSEPVQELSLERAPDGAALPLSYGQQRLFFLQTLFPKNPFYHYTDLYKITGNLDISSLLKSFELLCEKDNIFKQVFSQIDGNLQVSTSDKKPFEYSFFDIKDKPDSNRSEVAKSIALEQARLPFDLSTGPLFRIVIIQESETVHHLVLTMHHIITDKWSMQVLRKRLAYFYTALLAGENPTSEDLTIQYSDFSWWQRQKDFDPKELDFWKEKLSGDLPILELPTSKPKPESPSFSGGYCTQKFSPSLSKKLIDLSKKLNVTMFTLMLSTFKLLLHKYSGQEDIIIGTPFSNRDRRELEELIGFFNETLVIRSDLSKDISFEQLVGAIHKTVLDSFSNKNVPFEELVQVLNLERDGAQNPLFRAMFLYHQVPETPDFGSDLSIDYAPFDLGVAKFDLTLYISEDSENLSATFEYANDLFDRQQVERMLDHFCVLLGSITDDPEKEISRFPIIDSSEQEKLLTTWNNTSVNQASVPTIHSLIKKVVQDSPEAIACTSGEDSITYKELDNRASKLARLILTNTKQISEPRIGLFIDRSVDLVVGILAILKAGGSYIPLDPDYPPERTSMILEDAEVPLILTAERLTDRLPNTAAKLLYFKAIDQPSITHMQPFPSIDDQANAYIIYTSGSSGKPKGVPISHQNLLHSTQARFSFYETNPKHFLLLSSFSFDSSVVGIFWTLCTGGNLVIPAKRIEQDMDQLASLIQQETISHTLMLPSLYQLLLKLTDAEKLTSLDTVVVAGEACPIALPHDHFSKLPDTKIYNEYGPTEASVWCIAHKFSPADAYAQIPIGKPIPNTQAYVLDKALQPKPIGFAGELYIGGKGIANGYLNRPNLTRERFIENPFGPGKLYRTGDLAQYRPNGLIDFLGRADDQIKIRGFRVELEEITNCITPISSVTDAITIALKDPVRLMSFVVGQSAEESEILAHLKKQLPAHMVPNAIIKLDQFPRLPNGKINLKELQALNPKRTTKASTSTQPSTEMEILLAEIWKEVLGIESIGLEDNFFDLGGDSILSIQILSKARSKGISMEPNHIFKHQTIGQLALYASLTSGDQGENSLLVTGHTHKTPIQEWYFENFKNAPEHWHQAVSVKVDSEVAAEMLEKALQQIVQEHDALRLSYTTNQAEFLEPQENSILQYYQGLTKADQEVTLFQELSSTDLESGNLFTAYLFSSDTGQRTLYLSAHHLVVDTVSWSIIIDDLGRHCSALLANKSLQSIPKTTSYKEWATHLKESVSSKESQLSYWQTQAQTSIHGSLPKMSSETTEKHLAQLFLTLSKTETEQLLSSANETYQTKTPELLLTGLMLTLNRWREVNSIQIGLEHHGRPIDQSGIDLSRTVGWFTSFFPVTLGLDEGVSIQGQITSIKEQLRAIPDDGIGYGQLRYLHVDEAVRDSLACEMPILFNYLGVETENSTSLFTDHEMVFEGTRSPNSESKSLLQINSWVKNDELSIMMTYPEGIISPSEVEKIGSTYKKAILEVLDHCVSATGKFTPSDFPDVELDQDELDQLLGNFEL